MKSRTAANYKELIANALWSYVSQPQSQESIYHIIQKTLDVYEQPLQSWLTYPIYCFSRKRSPELVTLIQDLTKAESHQQFVRTFVKFFETEPAGWESTSANVLIMRGLMMAVYSEEENDNKFVSDEAIKKINEKLRERAKQPIVEKQQPVPLMQAEVKKCPPIDFKTRLEQLNQLFEKSKESSTYVKFEAKPVRELSKASLTPIEAMFKTRMEKPSKPAEKFLANPHPLRKNEAFNTNLSTLFSKKLMTNAPGHEPVTNTPAATMT